MSDSMKKWGFAPAGDLDSPSGGNVAPKPAPVPQPVPQPVPTPVVTPVVTPVATPVSAPKPAVKKSPFMMAGDLLDAADGRHAASKGSSWDEYRLDKQETVIGRNQNCDIVTNQAGTSSAHTRISQYNGRYVINDCNSQAGTYINGKKLDQAVYLKDRDQISVGSNNYVFMDGKLLYSKTDDPANRSKVLHSMRPDARPVILHADIQTKKVKSHSGLGMKELIRDIHVDVREGSLVAILGTAGAGKSTLMNCMNGMDIKGVKGAVMYRDVDLVHNFEQMQHLIGSVPQEKIFHNVFTPEEEFMQAAKLRLPDDTTDKEIKERVDRTLKMLSMNGVRKNKNSKLSGGEKTRVNVGIELVADRDLLCLDEPEQGLSPNYKQELFEILQKLAHDHCKTIITIIHDVSLIKMCDQVIMITKADGVGRLAFSGAPTDAKEFFGADFQDVYTLLERNPQKYVDKFQSYQCAATK